MSVGSVRSDGNSYTHGGELCFDLESHQNQASLGLGKLAGRLDSKVAVTLERDSSVG